MLFRKAQLAGITSGRITRTVRARKRAQARVGHRHALWELCRAVLGP